MHARRTTPRIILLAVAAAVAALAAPPAAVGADLGITLSHLRSSSVELVIVCPTDPPTTVLVLAGADQPAVIGQTEMSCVGGGIEQTVTVPLAQPLVAGATVDLSATVSGDSGEINAWFPGSVVETDDPGTLGPPMSPTHVRVHADRTRAVVTWRDPSTTDDPRVDGFRISRTGTALSLLSTTHRAVLRGLAPGRRYVFTLVSFNDAGDSQPVRIAVRTRGSGRAG